MGKLLKWTAAFFLMITLAVGTLLWWFDANFYKEQIARLVEEKTGRRLTIQGDLSLTLFPNLGIRIGQMSLANGAGFATEPFAQLTTAHLQVALQPLLKRHLQVQTLTIEGLQLHLEKNAAGQYNWHDLSHTSPTAGNRQSSAGQSEAGTTSPAATSSSSFITRSAIEELQIRDARIAWRDASRQSSQTVLIPILATGQWQAEQPLPIQLQLRLEADDQTINGLELDLKGALLWQGQERTARMTPLRFTLSKPLKEAAAGTIRLESHMNLLVDWQQERLLIDNWQMNGQGLSLSGRLEGKQLFSAPMFSGLLTLHPFSPRQVLPQWGLLLPATRDPQVFDKLEAHLPYTWQDKRLTLSDLRFMLDDSSGKGSLQLELAAQPVVRWQGELDKLNLDRYQLAASETPPQQKATASHVPPSGQAEAGKQSQPSKPAWQSVDGSGTLRIGTLQAAGLQLQEVNLTLQAAHGRLQLAPVQAKLYQGTLQMEGGADWRATEPQWRLDGRLAGVELGTLLQDLQGEASLSGLTNASARLTTQGTESALLKKHLQGEAQVTIKEGRMQGFDLEQILQNAQRSLQGEPASQAEGGPATRFSSLSGSATIHNGQVENRDLHMLSPLLQLRGAGKVDLPAERLDYHLYVTPNKALSEQGRTWRELAGVTIPVQAVGPWRQPTWKVDLKTLLEQEAAQKAKEKLADKLQDKASEALKKKGLDHLLPGDAGKRLLNLLPIR
ncbi:MAG: AsmA family protein [Magnetococcales bacterium]|nr:AsmA family protein [Magnetococcales bacterium]